jgi:hypothetical protein
MIRSMRSAAALAIAGVALTAACSSPAQTPARASATKPPVIAATTSSADALRNAVAGWDDTSRPAFDAWTGDMDKVVAAQQGSDMVALGDACSKLGDDAGTFSGYLPTPDARLTADLTRATQAAISAAGSCAGGDQASATSQIVSMIAAISASTVRINQITAGK